MTGKLPIEGTHPRYEAKVGDWEFYRLSYEGGKDFVKKVLFRHPRESSMNYVHRLNEAIYFNFPREIVDLYNFYLTEKEAARQFGDLAQDAQWKMFFNDVDGFGMDYREFFNECQKLSAIYGAVGILVDKPMTDAMTVGEEIKRGIYPYCSVYTLPNILDWEYGIDPKTGRSRLVYLKLREDEDRYYLWFLDRWERWEVVKDKNGRRSAEMVSSSEHGLGVIPMVYMINLHGITDRNFGLSDLSDIAPIAGSVVRDLSCGDEIIKDAGFPMLRMPQEEQHGGEFGDASEGSTGEARQVVIGSKAVHQFNPEYGGDAKPDWMPTEILEPIEAILSWTDRKSDEIYRICHLSGVHGQRKSNNEVSSGLALRYEFQQLSSVLNKKAANMNEAEYNVIWMWLLWQNKGDLLSKIEIRRARNFSIDELAMNLENTITSIQNVQSQTFAKLAQYKIVKQELPDISDEDLKIVKDEIAAAPTIVPGEQDQKKTSSSESDGSNLQDDGETSE